MKELTTWDVEFKNKASAEALANVVGQSLVRFPNSQRVGNLTRQRQTVLLPVPTSLGEGHLIWIGGEIGKDERPLKEGS